MALQDGEHTIALNNEVLMPEIGFGVWHAEEGPETVNAVKAALANNYRLIDTAAFYKNEKSVGEAIASSDVPRDQIFVTTKVWNDDIRAGKTKEAFDKSLKLLDLDYLDLYLLHWPVEGWQQAWKELETLYRDGRVKAIGVCNFEQDQLEELLDLAEIKPAVNQIETHVFQQQKTAKEYLKKYGCQIESWGPFAEGRKDMFTNPVLTQIGEKYGKTAAQTALRFLLQSDVVVIPKSTHKDRMQQNFDLFDFALTDEEVEQAAYRAELLEDIRTMPQGFDTYVGERGAMLSGGQKQRVAIARIFLKDPAILILDEATSALDSVTEAKIQGAFDQLSQGRTTLIIAHRLSTIRSAHRILVVQDGRIAEQGSHAQLLAENGAYARLYHTQNLGENHG